METLQLTSLWEALNALGITDITPIQNGAVSSFATNAARTALTQTKTTLKATATQVPPGITPTSIVDFLMKVIHELHETGAFDTSHFKTCAHCREHLFIALVMFNAALKKQQ